MINLIHDNCIDAMKNIPDGSVDLILTDPPYGTTPASWDTKINIKEMWKEFERIIKDSGAIVITAQQPFTSLLIASNLKMYKYNWIWQKDNGTNFLNSHYQPLKVTEDVCVFGKMGCSFNPKGMMKYNPQFTDGKPYTIKSGQQKSDSAVVRGGSGGREDVGGFETVSDGKRYPTNILKINRDKEKLHPTQKPVYLMEYLIKTYTDEGQSVLDPFAGSGTTGVACKKTNRECTLIEKEENYIQIIKTRI